MRLINKPSLKSRFRSWQCISDVENKYIFTNLTDNIMQSSEKNESFPVHTADRGKGQIFQEVCRGGGVAGDFGKSWRAAHVEDGQSCFFYLPLRDPTRLSFRRQIFI